MALILQLHNHHSSYYRSLFKFRAGQRLPSQQTDNVRSNDTRTEIDRRNQRILYPLNAKDSYGTQNYHSSFNYQKTKLSSNSFNLESYNSFCRNQRSLQRHDEHSINNFHHDKRTLLPTNNNNDNNNTMFLYGNSIIKTNKADILSILEQRSNSGDNSHTYINKYGVIIDEDGPFWPRDYRILYPTPKLLSREMLPKEFYLTANNSLLSSKSKYYNNSKVKKKRKEKRRKARKNNRMN